MKKTSIIILSLYASLLCAETPTERVQAKLNAIASMSANFTQVVKAGKRQVSNTKGTMALSRPGKFRWQTKSPMEQLVVADGKKLWIYDVDLEQVTVKKQEKSVGGTPALFLSNTNDTVSKDFNVVRLAGKGESFELQAKSPKENYQRVTLTFNGKELSNIEFYDQLGQQTNIRLSEIKNNPSLPNDLFEFKPPKGVDVVKQ